MPPVPALRRWSRVSDHAGSRNAPGPPGQAPQARHRAAPVAGRLDAGSAASGLRRRRVRGRRFSASSGAIRWHRRRRSRAGGIEPPAREAGWKAGGPHLPGAGPALPCASARKPALRLDPIKPRGLGFPTVRGSGNRSVFGISCRGTVRKPARAPGSGGRIRDDASQPPAPPETPLQFTPADALGPSVAGPAIRCRQGAGPVQAPR